MWLVQCRRRRKIKGRKRGRGTGQGLNLVPPEEGFELYRYKNAQEMTTRRWSGLYWARKSEAGDYEIRAVSAEGEGYSYPGGVFPKEAFERYYEKAN